METGNTVSSDEDFDAFFCRRKQNSPKANSSVSEKRSEAKNNEFNSLYEKGIDQHEKFLSLKEKAEEIRKKSYLRQQKTEFRRSQKLIKKAMKDPSIKQETEANVAKNAGAKQAETWHDIKPFLTVNDHLHGSVSHGDIRPKTELQCKIEDAIKKGDLEEAEILSDTLANREFAVKIAQAFSAKRCSERLEKEKEKQKEMQNKKIRWTFMFQSYTEVIRDGTGGFMCPPIKHPSLNPRNRSPTAMVGRQITNQPCHQSGFKS